MSTIAMDAPKVNWLRPGFHSLTPYLHVANAAAQIEFLKRVFGAEELGRYPSPDGKRIMHAEMKIGDSVVEMGEPATAAADSDARLYPGCGRGVSAGARSGRGVVVSTDRS